jgi:hypothetical protein
MFYNILVDVATAFIGSHLNKEIVFKMIMKFIKYIPLKWRMYFIKSYAKHLLQIRKGEDVCRCKAYGCRNQCQMIFRDCFYDKKTNQYIYGYNAGCGAFITYTYEEVIALYILHLINIYQLDDYIKY